MKKSLITILIILIIAGGGYLAYMQFSISHAPVLPVDTVNDNQVDDYVNIKKEVLEPKTQTNDSDIPVQDEDPSDYIEKIKEYDMMNQYPVPPDTKTTITYMCEGRVKVVHVQDSPSLPPRVSYLRVSDNASIASYGDFGAYIRPEYFSIDRSKIEEGYSFNEVNFCKYLKN